MRDQIAEYDPEILFADGFDEALIGVTEHWDSSGHRVYAACYDIKKCVEILCRDGATREEAEEHLEVNTLGAYVGLRTPIFVNILVHLPVGKQA